LARSVVALVADEAVSARDASVQATILELRAELHAEMNPATLFITHDLRAAAVIADRMNVMQLGQIVARDDTGSVFRAPPRA
jgi:ABC-type oligopeptide transport system ATPase subunit